MQIWPAISATMSDDSSVEIGEAKGLFLVVVEGVAFVSKSIAIPKPIGDERSGREKRKKALFQIAIDVIMRIRVWGKLNHTTARLNRSLNPKYSSESIL